MFCKITSPFKESKYKKCNKKVSHETRESSRLLKKCFHKKYRKPPFKDVFLLPGPIYLLNKILIYYCHNYPES